jgi:chemotaxis protein CheC
MRLNSEQIDVLTELINIGVGRAAGMLNQMLDAHVNLQVPHVNIFQSSELEDVLKQDASIDLSVVRLSFKGSFSGTALLAFPAESSANLVNVLTGEEEEVMDDLDALRVGALTEVGNIVLSGVMGSISNVLKQHLTYSLPIYMEDSIKNLLDDRQNTDTTIVLARTHLKIEQFRISCDIILIFQVGLFDILLETIRELEE